MSRNHKPLPEFDVSPAEIPALVAVAHELTGVSPSVARGFGGWLVAVHAGVDRTTPQSAVRYRKILRRALDEQGKPPSRPARGQDGYASVKALGAVAAMSIGAAALARGNAPVALGSLYITMIEAEEADQELLAA